MKFFYAVLLSCIWGHFLAQTNLLQTDFQSGIPTNYTLLNLDNQSPDPLVLEYASGWITTADPENTNDTVAAASSYFENADTANRWLITPALQLGGFGNFISWEAKSHDPSFPDDYLVLVSTTTTDPSAFTDTIGYVQQENFEWTSREVNLSAQGYNDSTIYVAFVLRTFDGFKLYLDDIQVRKDDPVGYTENQIASWTIYPNPCSAFVSVQHIKDLLKLEILDLNGKVLLEATQESIAISTLNAGTYLLRCTTANGTYSKPLYKI